MPMRLATLRAMSWQLFRRSVFSKEKSKSKIEIEINNQDQERRQSRKTHVNEQKREEQHCPNNTNSVQPGPASKLDRLRLNAHGSTTPCRDGTDKDRRARFIRCSALSRCCPVLSFRARATPRPNQPSQKTPRCYKRTGCSCRCPRVTRPPQPLKHTSPAATTILQRVGRTSICWPCLASNLRT